MRFRRLHRGYAALFGFFWLPCPLCGREFGGHEWRDRNGLCSSIPTGDPGVATGICPNCTRAGYGFDDGSSVGYLWFRPDDPGAR